MRLEKFLKEFSEKNDKVEKVANSLSGTTISQPKQHLNRFGNEMGKIFFSGTNAGTQADRWRRTGRNIIGAPFAIPTFLSGKLSQGASYIGSGDAFVDGWKGLKNFKDDVVARSENITLDAKNLINKNKHRNRMEQLMAQSAGAPNVYNDSMQKTSRAKPNASNAIYGDVKKTIGSVVNGAKNIGGKVLGEARHQFSDLASKNDSVGNIAKMMTGEDKKFSLGNTVNNAGNIMEAGVSGFNGAVNRFNTWKKSRTGEETMRNIKGVVNPIKKLMREREYNKREKQVFKNNLEVARRHGYRPQAPIIMGGGPVVYNPQQANPGNNLLPSFKVAGLLMMEKTAFRTQEQAALKAVDQVADTFRFADEMGGDINSPKDFYNSQMNHFSKNMKDLKTRIMKNVDRTTPDGIHKSDLISSIDNRIQSKINEVASKLREHMNQNYMGMSSKKDLEDAIQKNKMLEEGTGDVYDQNGNIVSAGSIGTKSLGNNLSQDLYRSFINNRNPESMQRQTATRAELLQGLLHGKNLRSVSNGYFEGR